MRWAMLKMSMVTWNRHWNLNNNCILHIFTYDPGANCWYTRHLSEYTHISIMFLMRVIWLVTQAKCRNYWEPAAINARKLAASRKFRIEVFLKLPIWDNHPSVFLTSVCLLTLRRELNFYSLTTICRSDGDWIAGERPIYNFGQICNLSQLKRTNRQTGMKVNMVP